MNSTLRTNIGSALGMETGQPYVTSLAFQEHADVSPMKGPEIYFAEHDHANYLKASNPIGGDPGKYYLGGGNNLLEPSDLVSKTGNTWIYKMPVVVDTINEIDHEKVWNDSIYEIISAKQGNSGNTAFVQLQEQTSSNDNAIYHASATKEDPSIGTATLPATYQGWKVIAGKYLIIYDITDIQDITGQDGISTPNSDTVEWRLEVKNETTGGQVGGIATYPAGVGVFQNQPAHETWTPVGIKSANVTIDEGLEMPLYYNIEDADMNDILLLNGYAELADSSSFMTGTDSGISMLSTSSTPLDDNSARIRPHDTDSLTQHQELKLSYRDGGAHPSYIELGLAIKGSSGSNFLNYNYDNATYWGTVPHYTVVGSNQDFADMSSTLAGLSAAFDLVYNDNMADYQDEDGVLDVHTFCQDFMDDYIDMVDVGSFLHIDRNNGYFSNTTTLDGGTTALEDAIWIMTPGEAGDPT